MLTAATTTGRMEGAIAIAVQHRALRRDPRASWAARCTIPTARPRVRLAPLRYGRVILDMHAISTGTAMG